MNRVNMDAYVNNNGKRLIGLCKISDLKIANSRRGRDANAIVLFVLKCHLKLLHPIEMPMYLCIIIVNM